MDTPHLHILIDDDGIPRTIHRRVKVKMIVQRHIFANEPLTSIAEHYGLDMADVHAAMAYYYDNKEAMDADFERMEALTKQFGVSGAELEAKIRQRLKEKGITID
jgi:uncharacterized protein (DUF433 family)